MNKTEVAQLLTIASGFDRRVVDEISVQAWYEVLNPYGYVACQRAVVQHQSDPATRHTYLTVGHVLDRVEQEGRARSADVEADVRSAKARGLIADTWGKRDPLPGNVAAQLRAARERDRRAAEGIREIGSGADDDG